MAEFALSFVKGVVTVYDFITFPVYTAVQKPWIKVLAGAQMRGCRLDRTDLGSPWVRIGPSPPKTVGGHKRNVADFMREILATYGDQKCLGVRPTLSETSIVIDGKTIIKKSQGPEYEFISYRDVDMEIDKIARGLLSVGVKVSTFVIVEKIRINLTFLTISNMTLWSFSWKLAENGS